MNTARSNNTASGNNALCSNIFEEYNIAIGYGEDISNGPLSNRTALGFDAKVNSSNKVHFGNTSVNIIEGQAELVTTISDTKEFPHYPISREIDPEIRCKIKVVDSGFIIDFDYNASNERTNQANVKP